LGGHGVGVDTIARMILPSEARKEDPMRTRSQYPKGSDAARVKRVLAHYETQTDEEAPK
jgi:hypothetical protein